MKELNPDKKAAGCFAADGHLKAGYPTRRLAKAAAKKYGQRLYRCTNCNYYHLTSKDKPA